MGNIQGKQKSHLGYFDPQDWVVSDIQADRLLLTSKANPSSKLTQHTLHDYSDYDLEFYKKRTQIMPNVLVLNDILQEGSCHCGIGRSLLLMMQRIQARLSDFYNIQVQQNLLILLESLHGYQQLQKLYKSPYLVNDRMINLSQNLQIHVWMSSNHVKNKPDQELASTYKGQDQMIESIINCVEEHIIPSSPNPYDQLRANMRYPLSFGDVIKQVQILQSKYKTIHRPYTPDLSFNPQSFISNPSAVASTILEPRPLLQYKPQLKAQPSKPVTTFKFEQGLKTNLIKFVNDKEPLRTYANNSRPRVSFQSNPASYSEVTPVSKILKGAGY